MQTAVWTITYLVQDRGSFKHSSMLKCYLELTHTKGSQDSLPLTDNNFLKCLNVLLQLRCPVSHLVLLTGQAANVDLLQVRLFQEKRQTWNKAIQELFGYKPLF